MEETYSKVSAVLPVPVNEVQDEQLAEMAERTSPISVHSLRNRR
jgi:hypothetical protein